MAMARAKRSGARRRRSPGASPQLDKLRRNLARLSAQLGQNERQIRQLTKQVGKQAMTQRALAAALELGESPRTGDRGALGRMQDSIVRVEDYLLKTADRIETILTALKQHREFLANVNQRLQDVGTKDRIRLELDVMKNTLSILALSGVEVDGSLVKEIDKLRASVKEAGDLAQLERAKADLDKRFDGELKRFDLDAIWSKRKEIPGYG